MKNEITKYLQGYIDRMEAKGITPTMGDLNRKAAEFTHIQNNAPRARFEGYSSFEMHTILHFPFNGDSPVLFNRLSPEEYRQVPLLRQITMLMEVISESGQIKLTAAGYLPVKIVQKLYPLGVPDEMIEKGITKLGREADCTPVYLARILAETATIVKNRKGVLTLTAKGVKAMGDSPALFDIIFQSFCQKFNWHYFDDYTDDAKSGTIGQMGFGFSLVLLCKYGDTERLERFYAHKYFEAFPNMQETIQPTYGTLIDYCSDCYCLRTFDRFLYHFGLVAIKKEGRFDQEEIFIRKTPLFDRLVSLTPHRESGML